MNRGEFLSKAFKLAVGKALEVATESPVIDLLEDIATPKERPPGAVGEKEFLDRCTGCDQCMIACPVNAIVIEDLERRDPWIFPEKEPCIQCEDTPCVYACKTAALTPLASSTESRAHPELSGSS